MIRVLLVDDQTLIRQGIAMLLELEPDLEVVGAVGDGRAAIEAVEKLRPDVVLMDVRMPGMDGVTATRELSRRFPEVGVIILTTFDDDEYVFEGLKAGARGYLLKDISSEEMAEAVRTVARGEALIQPSIARKVVAEFSRLAVGTPPASERMLPRSPNALTERELDVLKALARGMSNKEIAAALVITEGTVKTHISNILAKLEVRDRTQAVLKAQQLRLLDEG
ncbi:MAG: response regulator transcription factor [Roseiflexaceae bacterium]|nr:response regulator transcription factor [Roseiflexus sp.]MDW8215490.1 response regulator transcription factor [Roseiflexaceae bacterium]